MPRSRNPITNGLAPLAALALGATGCAAIEPLETTGLYETVRGTSDTAWCQQGDDARLYENGSDLRGPHFSISFLCHYAGSEIPEHVVAEAEQLDDLPQLISGAEYLVNQMAIAPTYESEHELGAVEAWIEAGGQKLELGSLPVRGGYVAVTVPAGDDAVLWVEDEGRAQGLDLRTGAQIDPIGAYYNDLGLGAFAGSGGYEFDEIKMINDIGVLTVTCSSSWSEVTRSVWSEERGWAADGHAHLTFQFRWCGSEDSEYLDYVHWKLDRGRALKVWNDDESYEPVEWNEGEDQGDGWVLETAVFEIPVEAAELTFEFTPVGELKALGRAEAGGDFQFSSAPEPGEWEVSF
ncbi:hypothetical protein [Glycomyces halotolerans]